MNSAIFYITSMVFSTTALFALWQLGLKRLMLDDFRDSLFATRDRLYMLASEGKITCDDEAYRAVEVFINRTIRYAHRFTFLSFIQSVRELGDAPSQEVADSPSHSLIAHIDAVSDEAVRNELKGILIEVTTSLPRYIGKSSLMFIIGSLIYVVFRSVSPLIARSKQKAIETFEVEAYRDEKFSKLSPA